MMMVLLGRLVGSQVGWDSGDDANRARKQSAYVQDSSLEVYSS